MVTEDERRLLQLIYTLKHPTTRQVHAFAFSHLAKRTVELRLEALRAKGMIDVHLLYPEQGARSPRYYHLLAAGAREIGIAKLGSHHYRPERREFFHARSASQELAYMAEQHGWLLYTGEKPCRELLTAFFVERGRQRHGEVFPAHTLAALMPRKVQPDRILVTDDEVLLCIIAHPHSGRAFWHERAERYQHLLRELRAVAIVLTEAQAAECRDVLVQYQLNRRVLPLLFNQFSVLEQRLTGASSELT